MKNVFNPQDETALTVLSYGAGQDSTAMLLMMLHDTAFRDRFLKGRLLVVFSDTLNEHPHTYRYLKYVQAICEHHAVPFKWIRPNDGFHPESWSQGLQGHYRKYQVIMSRAMRNKSCTHGLKIQPIYNYLSHYVNDEFLYGLSQPKRKIALKAYAARYGKIQMLIGISSEEAGRRIQQHSQDRWMELAIKKCYPLHELDLTRADCQSIIRSLGYQVPFPSNCIMCPFASKKELLWLSRNLPEQLQAWYEYEQAKIQKFRDQQASRGKNNHTVFGGKKTLYDVLREAEKEFGHLTDEELESHKFSHGHCVLSAY